MYKATLRFFSLALMSMVGINVGAQTMCNPVELPYRFAMPDKNSKQLAYREAADPTVLLSNGEYFLFTSKNNTYFRSKNLIDWSPIAPKGLEDVYNGYAPTVAESNEKFYYTYSGGTQKIWESSSLINPDWRYIQGSGTPQGQGDPAIFVDDDNRIYLYYGCTDSVDKNIWGVELDAKTLKAKGKAIALINVDRYKNGWETFGEHNEKVDHKPWIEGSWMTKVGGRYYLQYAAPGTEMRSYCDAVYVSENPLGPFRLQQNNPFSYKPTGFAAGAGHGSTFADRYGNLWHATTTTICVRHMFERRLVLYPTFVDADGELYSWTGFGDFPIRMPQKKVSSPRDYWTGWMLLSYKKPVTVSSSAENHPAENAVDEDLHTWWSANTGNEGEYYTVDLEKVCTVNAIQLNFADEGADLWNSAESTYKYVLEVSADGNTWTTVSTVSATPHDYIELPKAVEARYVRLTNKQVPSGKFSLYGLRVFGNSHEAKPTQTNINKVTRTEDGRNAVLTWDASTGAKGYNIRYGRAADKLYENILVWGDVTSFNVSVLNADADYYFAIDAFNESGVTEGIDTKFLPRNGKTVYSHVFAPSEGFVNATEKDYRHEICLNGYWNFQPVAVPSDYKQGGGKAPLMPMPTEKGWSDVQIKIPSPWNINKFAYRNLIGPDHRNYPSYPEEWNEVKMAWMKKSVTIPADWTNERILLHFEAVAGCTEVFVNGKKAGQNFDLFLPFELDITSKVTPGQTAEILVGVRSQKLFEDNSTIGRRIVPAGSMFGYDMNGIWQDVYLLSRPEINVSDIYVKPLVSKGVLEIEATLFNHTSKKVGVSLQADVKEWINLAGTDVNDAPVPAWQLGSETLLQANTPIIYIEGNNEQHYTIQIPVTKEQLKYWTPENPNLNALLLTVKNGKKVVDRKYERFGWREWTIQGTNYCLNGKPYQLKSDSWHFMGVPQMTRRYAWAWFTAIKGMNGNAVRLHAQVYPRLYHDMADEMGICILDETANWASDGGPKFDSDLFWEHSRDHLARFVRRDRNHPSVFGWSISNENRPVILYVFKRPDLMPRQREAWKEWLQIVKDNDTTRPWISSDGEDDGDGILPVTVGHYGDLNAMKKWKKIGKPWGIGETSMAYYGTPEQISKVNGQRAYESMQGRMEGLAVESYDLIREMRNMGASYSTVFNMAWYALKPLPLGKKDITAKPSLENDGIWFTNYREGKPGIQPERIGSYCTTFNPGYDPSLPLYDPWPMYDAMRAVNAGTAPASCQWEKVDTMQYHHNPIFSTPVQYENTYVISSDTENQLKNIMDAQGVKMDKVKNAAKTLVVIDAAYTYDDKTIAQVKKWQQKGATIWLWNIVPETAEFYNSNLLAIPVEIDNLKRSSYLPENRSWMQGLNNRDFYFCELQKEESSKHSLKGAFVTSGEVLLNACRTDWRRWNRQAEEAKTASVLRSENETTQALPVFVRNGKVFISTLSNFTGQDRGFNTLSRILVNAGISFNEGSKGQDMLKKAESIERDANNLLLDPSVDTSKKTTK